MTAVAKIGVIVDENKASFLVICSPFGMLLIKFQPSVKTHLHDKVAPAITRETQSQNHNS